MRAPGPILQRTWFALWLATGFAFTLAMSNTIAVCPSGPSPSRPLGRAAGWLLLDLATLGDRGGDIPLRRHSRRGTGPVNHLNGNWR